MIIVSRSTISGNTAAHHGGGIYTFNSEGTEALIEDSRITGNDVPQTIAVSNPGGGGIYAALEDEHSGLEPAKITIAGSTIDNNNAYYGGGGVFVCPKGGGILVVVNSTLSANRTTDEDDGEGGGVYIAHDPVAGDSVDVFLRNITVTQNASILGGGVWAKAVENVRVRVDNSIISENFNLADDSDPNRAQNNLVGPIVVDESYNNLVGSDSAVLDSSDFSSLSLSTLVTNNAWIVDDDPNLGLLQNNGGPTPTHALLSGSAAIDAGDNYWATIPLTGVDPVDPSDDTPLTTDQRGTGFGRKFDISGYGSPDPGVIVDIGAYEIGLPKVIDVRLNGVQPGGETPWVNEISYAKLVPLGQQLRRFTGMARTRLRSSSAKR